MPARSIDTASISFGLVAIPCRVFSTTEPSHEIHFHMIHAGCGERVHQALVCPKHGTVTRDHIAKGYEVSKGKSIELDPKELAALDAVANDEIEIREFVPATAVDPIFIDRSYYLAPAKGGNKAYRLLRDALADAELVAIAAYAARGKSYIVMVRPFQTGLVMHQLRYADEVKPWKEVDVGELPKPSTAELGMARSLVDHLRKDAFDPARYKDEVKTRVRALLADKAKHGETIETPEPAPRAAAPTDLMAALRASLATPHKAAHKPARKPAHKAAAKTSRPARAHRPSHSRTARAAAS